MSLRASVIRGDHVEYSFWLVFDADGSMRFTRTRPATRRTERAMGMTATLPLSLFKTPELSGSITVAAPSGEPPQIDVQAASDALRAALGVDIDLRVNEG